MKVAAVFSFPFTDISSWNGAVCQECKLNHRFYISRNYNLVIERGIFDYKSAAAVMEDLFYFVFGVYLIRDTL